MVAEGQLTGWHVAQREGRSRQGAGRTEQNVGTGSGLLHEGYRVGRDAHQGFGAVERAGDTGCGRGCAGLEPGLAPADDVGGQPGEQHLQSNFGG